MVPSSEGVSSSLEACCLLTMCCLLLQLPSEVPCDCEALSFRWRWSCHSDRSGQQGTQAADASPLGCTPHLAPFRGRRHCPAKCHATHSWLRHTPRCSGSAGRCDHAHHALSSACIRKVHPSCDVQHDRGTLVHVQQHLQLRGIACRCRWRQPALSASPASLQLRYSAGATAPVALLAVCIGVQWVNVTHSAAA